jgi:hypothetical protein
VLDVGLSEANRSKLAAFGVAVKAPGIDIDYPDREKWEQKATYFRAMTSRPSIPNYFPGYDAYMWIDADTWVQTHDALETMLPGAAASADLFIASEYDAAYKAAFHGGHLWECWLEAYLNNFPNDIALGMRFRPMLNVGVFALSPCAPHWKIWHETLREALARIPVMEPKNIIMEQLALNLAIHRDNLPVQLMPAEYNWMAISGLPVWDEKTLAYVRPFPPYRPISILHLAAGVKNSAQKILTVTGRTIERPLTHSAAVAERNKAA